MTCYNGDKYLKESLKSIKSQSYEMWELVFVDNNSTDDSKKILFSNKDKRIKYFKLNKTVSLGKVRKFAYSKCYGSLITFLDVDDYWHKNKLAEQVKKFEINNKIDVLYSNYYQHSLNNLKKINKKLFSGYCQKNIIESYINGSPLTAWLTLMIKKESIDKLDSTFDENLHISSDFDLILRLSKFSYFDFSNKYLSYYRLHNNNLSKNNYQEITELNYIIHKYENDTSISNLLNLKNFSDKILLKNYIYKKILNKKNVDTIKLKNIFFKFLYLCIKIMPLFILKYLNDFVRK